jgi:hypothetical protein
LTGALPGRRLATEYEAIAYEPNRLVAWKAVSGPLPLTFSRAFEGVEGGTRVTMRYEGDRGLLRLAGGRLSKAEAAARAGNVKNVEVRVRSSDCGVGRRGQKGAIDRGA